MAGKRRHTWLPLTAQHPLKQVLTAPRSPSHSSPSLQSNCSPCVYTPTLTLCSQEEAAPVFPKHPRAASFALVVPGIPHISHVLSPYSLLWGFCPFQSDLPGPSFFPFPSFFPPSFPLSLTPHPLPFFLLFSPGWPQMQGYPSLQPQLFLPQPTALC